MTEWSDGRRLLVGVVAFLVGLVALLPPVFVEMASLSCEAPGDGSNYGTITWSARPPGLGCTWTEDINGFDARHDPSPATSALVVVWAGLLVGSWVVAMGALALPGHSRRRGRSRP